MSPLDVPPDACLHVCDGSALRLSWKDRPMNVLRGIPASLSHHDVTGFFVPL